MSRNKNVVGYKGFMYDVKKKQLYCQPRYGNRTVYSKKEIASVKGKLQPCENGLHFCGTMGNVLYYYHPTLIKFFGIVETDNSECVKHEKYGDPLKFVSKRLRLVKLLPTSEALKLAGYTAKSGKRTFTDINATSKFELMFETPALLAKFLKRNGAVPGVGQYLYSNTYNLLNVLLITEIF